MNNYYKLYNLFGLLCLGYGVVQAVETPEERFLQAAYQNDLATVKKSIEQEHVDVNVKRHAGYVQNIRTINGKTNERRHLDFFDSQFHVYGSTALQYAAAGGSTAVIKYLLAVPGTDIDGVSHGINALQRALIHENFECAYELIKAGADYKVISTYGQTARELALQNGSDQALRIVQLIDNLEHYKPQLYRALEENNEPQVRLLLQKVPYTFKEQDGNTLLHRAVKHCSPELVGLILKLDTKAITLYNKQDQTPVDVALSYNRSDIVELFTKLAHVEPEPINYSEDPCAVPFCTIV